MAFAAILVWRSCVLDFDSCVFRLKTSPTLRINRPSRKVPQMAATSTVNLPNTVAGLKSPYPTVVMVITTK